MDKTRYFLIDEVRRQNCLNFIKELYLNAGVDWVVEIRPKTRSDEQNKKFHAALGDISRQVLWQGIPYDLYGWKNLLVSGHTIATKQPYELVMGLEGELVNVRESTAKMGIKRMSSLIEYTIAWGEFNQVKFGDWRF